MQISTTVQHQAEMKLGTRLSSFMRQENSFINWYKSAGVLTQMLQSDWLSFSKSMSYYRVSRARRLTMCMSLSCQNSNTSRSFSLDFYVKYISNKRPSHHPFSRNFKKVLGHLFEELRFFDSDTEADADEPSHTSYFLNFDCYALGSSKISLANNVSCLIVIGCGTFIYDPSYYRSF